MRAWLEQGYFAPSQPCKPLSSPAAAATAGFQPLSSCFPPAMQQQPQQQHDGSEASGRSGSRQPAAHSDSGEERAAEDEQSDADEPDSADEEEEAEDPQVAARLAALKATASTDSSQAAVRAAVAEIEHSWHYMDDSGVLRGPFPTSHMRAWHAAGYFKPDTAVRRDDESDVLPIQHRLHTDFISTSGTASTAAAAPAPAASVAGSADTASTTTSTAAALTFYTPAADETDWYYTDRAGVERGPFSTSLMRHWHAKGWLTHNDCPLRPAHMPPSASAPLRLQLKPPDFVLPLHTAAADAPGASPTAAGAVATSRGATVEQQWTPLAEQQWLYLDSGQRQQGPFGTAAMAQWWRSGFLPPDTRIKRAGELHWSTIADTAQHCSFVQQAAAAPLTAPVASTAAHYHRCQTAA